MSDSSSVAPRTYGLLAEFTHACPLHCPYCSNPLALSSRATELSTDVWERVMSEAAELGVVQIGCSGGEPLLFAGLDTVLKRIRLEKMYSNLITSGLGLTHDRALRLADAGLDVVQISFQSADASVADKIAGTIAHDRKLRACESVHYAGLPLGLNVVLHRGNIGGISEIIDLALHVGAERIELANVQFTGWAWKNRLSLLPTRQQVIDAAKVVDEAVIAHGDRLQIVYVLPDLFGIRPKPCLHGWGQRGMTVGPSGAVMPCQAAEAIPGMTFENVNDRSLADIWRHSSAFQRFRGDSWMQDPCRSCPERAIDFGGCRCQAALWTGDPSRADPVCSLSPDRPMVDALLQAVESSAGSDPWTYRSAATSSAVTVS